MARKDSQHKRRRCGKGETNTSGHADRRDGRKANGAGLLRRGCVRWLCVDGREQPEVVEAGDAAVDETDDSEPDVVRRRARP